MRADEIRWHRIPPDSRIWRYPFVAQDDDANVYQVASTVAGGRELRHQDWGRECAFDLPLYVEVMRHAAEAVKDMCCGDEDVVLACVNKESGTHGDGSTIDVRKDGDDVPTHVFYVFRRMLSAS
jgi:hypothetical protein